MKRLFRLFAAFALLTGAWACSDDKTSEVRINDGAEFLSLDYLARSGKITVNAPAPWTVILSAGSYGGDERPDWVTLSAEEGPEGYSEIDVTFAANPGPARSALLLFICNGKTSVFTLSQSAKDTGFDSPDYYFYAAFGTMPALYSGLHLLSHDKPSYFFYERPQTYDPELFPDYATVFTAANPNAEATTEEIYAMSEQMKRRILEINAEDPTAVFGLYVTDLACRAGYDWFVEQGIDSARVKVTMLSDGTGTYNNFYKFFGDPATAEQNWNDYADRVEALDWNHGGRYPETRAPQDLVSDEWIAYLSTRPNYRLMLQNASLMESSGPFMTQKLAEMKMESVQPYELLTALPEEAKKEFYRMANFDYDRFKALFDASPKGNHPRHEPHHRREPPTAGRLRPAHHGPVRQRIRRVLQTPPGGQLVVRLRRAVPGTDAPAGTDAVRDLRLVAARRGEPHRRLSLDDVPLGAARQGRIPLCDRRREPSPAAEPALQRRPERRVDAAAVTHGRGRMNGAFRQSEGAVRRIWSAAHRNGARQAPRRP